MNKSILFLIITTLIIVRATATPLKDTYRAKKARTNIQTIMDIRFSDDDDDSSLFDPSDEASKCAKGSTFCEQLRNYPTSEFKSILKESALKYEELFGSDFVKPNSIQNRFAGVEDEEQLCSSQIRLVYPQAALTQDNTWRFIINHSNYTQGVRVDECIHTKQCKMMHNLPYGYKSQCKQKYIYRQLVAIDEEGKTIKDLFKIPSCCQCVLTRSFGLHR